MADVHEFAVVRFKAGIPANEQLQSMKKLDEFIAPFEGFKMREYFYSEDDNRWVDHIVWATMESATASEKVLEHPAAAAIFEKFEVESTVFSRCEKMSK